MAADVRVRIIGDNSSLTSALAGADNSVLGWANKVTGVFKGLIGLAAGGALAGIFKRAIGEAIESERGIEALRVTVDNAGKSFDAWGPRIENVIQRLQRVTRFSDDELRAALQQTIVITGDVAGSLRNLSLVTDVAADKNRGLEDASKIVGLAMAGNTKQLRQYGIDLKESTNPVEELRAKVIGLAQAQTIGLGGALDQIRKQFGEVLEAIGGVITGHDDLASSGNKLADALANLATWIETNEAGIRGFGGAIGTVFSGLMTVLKGAGDGVRLLGSIWLTTLSAMGSVAADVIGGLGFLLKAIGVDAVSEHAKKLRDISERHMAEAKALGAKALGQTQELAENSVLAWEKAQTTILTDEEFYGTKRTQVVSKGAAERKKIADKEAEDYRKLLEKMTKDSEQHLQKTGANIAKLITTQNKEAAEAAEQLRLAITGALGATTQAMLLRSGDAIERILTTLKQRIPIADYERLKALAGEYERTLRDALPPAEALEASVRQLQEDEKKLLGTSDEVKRKFEEKIDKARTLASGILQMADAMGLVDDEAANVLNSVIQIGSSLPKALGGDAGSIVNVLGGLANIIAGLGNSELQRKIREVTGANTQAIEKLTRSVGDLALGLPGNRFQGVWEALFEARKAGGTQLTEEAGNRARETLIRELAKRGITRDEAEEVLRTLGIKGVFDKETEVGLIAIRDALMAFSKAEIGKVGQKFTEQLRAIMDAFEIFKIEDADDKIAELRKLFSKFSPALADVFAGLDLGTKEGLATMKERLQALFTKILGPGLTPKELGDLSGGEVIDAIKQLLGLLGGADAVRTFLGPLGGVGTPPPTGGTLGSRLPSFDDALGNIPRVTTNISGGFNVTFHIDGARAPREIAEEVADILSETFGQRYDHIVASQGSGVAAV